MITDTFDVDTSQTGIAIAQDSGEEAASRAYDNTCDGQYVPEEPMGPDMQMLQNTLGRVPTERERLAFEEAYTEAAEDYNCNIEMYSPYT